MSTRHPAGRQLPTDDLVSGLRSRAAKTRPEDPTTAHWLELAADRLAGLDRELAAQKAAPKVNRRTRRALKSKSSTTALTPAQINGYKPRSRTARMQGGRSLGR